MAIGWSNERWYFLERRAETCQCGYRTFNKNLREAAKTGLWISAKKTDTSCGLCLHLSTSHDQTATSWRSWEFLLPRQHYLKQQCLRSRCLLQDWHGVWSYSPSGTQLYWTHRSRFICSTPLLSQSPSTLARHGNQQMQQSVSWTCSDNVASGEFWKFWDRIMNKEVLQRAGMLPLADIVAQRWFRFAGKFLCLLLHQPAKVAMTWFPHRGKRKRGGPKTTWCRTIIDDLEHASVNLDEAEAIAADQQRWTSIAGRCAAWCRRN